MSLLNPTQPALATVQGYLRNGLCKNVAHIHHRRAGRYLERVVTSAVPTESPIIRIPDEEYVDEDTGEVLKDFTYILKADGTKHRARRHETRDPNYVRKVCNKFKWKVRANAHRARIFLTLTYAENMTDTHRLYEDFRRFWMRVKEHYKCIDDYLVAFEPQERGAWHAHVILLSKRQKLFIPNRRFHKLWGHGFTKTKSASGINNIAEYLTAYLVNVKEGEHTKKGARLHYYPSHFQFLRSSRGADKPEDLQWWGDNATRIPNLDLYEPLYDYYRERYIDEGHIIQQRRFMLITKSSLVS